MAELNPASLANLARRMFREHEVEGKVFDLPSRSFWRGSAELDTSVLFHGRRAAHPLGPAAGPHGQMAQNIVLAWLAGSRIIELKTVQVQDRLSIPRPCIDMANVGYNVEWSQELCLAESLSEYVTGSMLLDMLRASRLPDGPLPEKDDTILDMSVGYDLHGVRSPAVRSWIEGMKDAGASIERLRREIPDELRRFRDLDFRTAISSQITLSTFHGCPAGEIEDIARFLLDELEVDVTVKLNPTLLGQAEVDELLHDVLGYTEIQTRAEDFEKDLRWSQALEVCERLSEQARTLGRGFGVKLSNTLVVKNHRDVFPKTEQVQYLSGQPLHVITLGLVERFREACPELPISFSAGVDNKNFADCVALGLVPVTTCTDLLRPGGYGRLPRYLSNLEERMRQLGVTRLGDYVVKALGQGERAIRDSIEDPDLSKSLLESLRSPATDLAGCLHAAGQGRRYEVLVRRAAVLNTPRVLDKVRSEPRYSANRNRAVPRKIGSQLWLFDCINCDKCLPVCPNDANFVYEARPLERDYANHRVQGDGVVAVPGGRFVVGKKKQIANFQDFCNECGNCDTFCPEDGGPFVEKPRFFGSLESWRGLPDHDGFVVLGGTEEGDVIWGRLRGKEYRLDVDRRRDRATFGDGTITLRLRHSTLEALEASAVSGAPEGHEIDFSAYLTMALVVDGVLDPRRQNPINSGCP